MRNNSLYIGLMSGTSLDGVDGVLVRLPETPETPVELLASAYLPFSTEIRRQAMPESAMMNCIRKPCWPTRWRSLCLCSVCPAAYTQDVRAIGVHGQTIRHRPELGYTRQTNNPSLLAELTGIDVIADFRSRDIAAGGQGAPLVPAFHHAVFAADNECRVVANIGGISNISILARMAARLVLIPVRAMC
jgi:anhydro-N-acetylmuramic acid kinase